MHNADIVIVTPALAAANNGNWQTARRWASMLRGDYRVQLVERWNPTDADGGGGGDEVGDEVGAGAARLMIALHARRSAASIAAWRQRWPARPLVVVLTGTDLYRDIVDNAAAQRSLALADRLVVLQARGAAALPAAYRPKAVVCLQSSPPRVTVRKTARHLRALMVGHLREEKSPSTYFDAVRLLGARRDILLDHIGAALDAELGAHAARLTAHCPTYRWLGAQPHGATRRRIQAAHLLVHPSRIEGGAHVVIEAVMSGTPVLASRIDGNVGLLGDDYGGYFPWGDAQALAALLARCRDDPVMLDALCRQCAARRALFEPARERAVLSALAGALVGTRLDKPSAPLAAPAA